MNDQAQWTVEVRVESGPHAGLQTALSASEIRIGRGLINEVALPDDHTVSERHARLYLQEGQWFAEDSGSRNGVFLERAGHLEQVAGAIPLSPGATLILGAARLHVSVKQTREECPAAAPVLAPPAAVLHIALAEGHLLYRFSGSDPLSRQYTVAYPPSLASRIGRDLDRLAQRCNRGETGGLAELHALGKFLSAQMVPQRVSELLAGLEGCPLILSHDSELIDVPWELALAGEQPWCARFALGRQIVLGDLSQRIRPKTGGPGLRMLIVADPQGDLPAAREEAEAFLGSLEQYRVFLDADFIGGSRATLPAVLRALEQVDLVYYVGHGAYDPARPEASGWQLSDGNLGPERIRSLSCPPRFVFSNACNSAEEVPQEKARMGRAANTGMASGLLIAGVEGCIAARWPIRAESSSALASAFFHRVLRGAPPGEALRDARLLVRRIHGENDLAWASFVLYGNPLQRLVPVAPGAVCK